MSTASPQNLSKYILHDQKRNNTTLSNSIKKLIKTIINNVNSTTQAPIIDYLVNTTKQKQSTCETWRYHYDQHVWITCQQVPLHTL